MFCHVSMSTLANPLFSMDSPNEELLAHYSVIAPKA
jgi:hypothetical protein